MADATPPPPPPPPPLTVPPAPRARLPLLPFALPALLVAIAALPLVLAAIAGDDPEGAVRLALQLRHAVTVSATGAVLLSVVALIAFPPFPAWLRRSTARVRTAWSIDRAPLQRALAELKHFENGARHLDVARLAWIRSDLRLALHHSQRAAELDPSLPAAWHLLGLCLLRIGALSQALTAFTNAEQLEPGHAFGEALLHTARLRHLLGEPQAAAATFAAHAERHGGSARADCWRGECLLAAGDRAGAAAAFRRAAEQPGKLTAEDGWFRAVARWKRLFVGGGR